MRGRLHALDGVRGIGALIVCLGHGTQIWQGTPHGLAVYVVHLGTLVIAIFFVLSAFLLYRPFARAEAGLAGPVDVRGYALRRFVRVVPAYWFALTVTAIVFATPGVFGHQWWVFYGFLQVYSLGTAEQGLPPAWSLNAEVVFYALLPVLALVLAHGRGWQPGRQLALLGTAGAGSWLLTCYVSSESARPYLASTFPCVFVYMAAGMALAVAVTAAERAGRRPRLLRRPGLFWPLALACFLIVCFGLGLSHDAAYPIPRTLPQSLAEVALTCLAATLVVAAGGLAQRRVPLADSRPAGWLGEVSFALYLWHYPILVAASKNQDLRALGPLGWLAVTVAASYAAAAISWYALERPLLRLTSRRGRPAARLAPALP